MCCAVMQGWEVYITHVLYWNAGWEVYITKFNVFSTFYDIVDVARI